MKRTGKDGDTRTCRAVPEVIASNRSKAILGIGILAIGIGAISKKVISYPSGGCMKGTQEMTFNLNKSILNKPWIS